MWIGALAVRENGTGIVFLEKVLDAILKIPTVSAHADVIAPQIFQSFNNVREILYGASQLVPSTSQVGTIASFGQQQAQVGLQVGRVAAQTGLEATERVTVNAVGTTAASASARIFQVAGAAVTVAFVAVEVSRLIGEWGGDQPAAGHANDTIVGLNRELSQFDRVSAEAEAMRTEIIEQERLYSQNENTEWDEAVGFREADSAQTATATEVATDVETRVLNDAERPPNQVVSEDSSTSRECICRDKTLTVLYINIQSMRPTDSNREKAPAFKSLLEKNNPDIVIIVETWLRRSDNIDQCWGLEGFDASYRYDRDMSSNEIEAERNGGGILVCWKRDRHAHGAFDLTEDLTYRQSLGNVADNAVRYFVITNNFKCVADECTKTRLTNSNTYRCAIVVAYRRPGPFTSTAQFTGENRADFNFHNQNLQTLITEYFSSGMGFQSLGYNGAALVGDLNFATWEGLEIPNLQRVEFTGPTSNRNSTPDVIASTPRELILDKQIIPVSIGTVHSALSFKIYFGKDCEYQESCEACLSPIE